MKKQWMGLTAAALIFSLAGCGGDKQANKPETAAQPAGITANADRSTADGKQLGYVTGDEVFVRELPSTTGKPITNLNRNTKVEILEGASKGSRDEYVLYEPVTALDTASNKSMKLNQGLALTLLRKEDSTGVFKFTDEGKEFTVKIYGCFASGTPMHVTSLEEQNWVHVKLNDGRTGWIYGQYVSYIVKEGDKQLAQANQLDFQGLTSVNNLVDRGLVYGLGFNTKLQSVANRFDSKRWRLQEGPGALYGPGFHTPEVNGREEHLEVGRDSVHYLLLDKDALNLSKYVLALDKRIEAVYGSNFKDMKDKTGNLRVYDGGDYEFVVYYSGTKDKVFYISLGIYTKSYINGINNPDKYAMLMYRPVM